MKEKMKEYEVFIKKEIEKGNHSKELLEYHKEMVRCFQHERLVHLIITLFFVAIALVALVATGFSIGNLDEEWWIMWPLYSMTLIVTILAVAYVKYYHYLENHTQKLYDLTGVIAGINRGRK